MLSGRSWAAGLWQNRPVMLRAARTRLSFPGLAYRLSYLLRKRRSLYDLFSTQPFYHGIVQYREPLDLSQKLLILARPLGKASKRLVIRSAIPDSSDQIIRLPAKGSDIRGGCGCDGLCPGLIFHNLRLCVRKNLFQKQLLFQMSRLFLSILIFLDGCFQLALGVGGLGLQKGLRGPADLLRSPIQFIRQTLQCLTSPLQSFQHGSAAFQRHGSLLYILFHLRQPHGIHIIDAVTAAYPV